MDEVFWALLRQLVTVDHAEIRWSLDALLVSPIWILEFVLEDLCFK